MSTRTCDGCSLCCVLPSFMPGMTDDSDDLWYKPGGKPCHHLSQAAHRCAIYAHRPKTCRAYNCAWVQGMLKEEHAPRLTGILVAPKGPDAVSVMTRPGFDPDALGDIIETARARAPGLAITVISHDGQVHELPGVPA